METRSSEYERAKQLLLRIRSLKSAVEANKIKYYRPRGRQRDFHAADTAEVRVVFGGNRSGKTTSGAVEAIAHSLGYRPWLKKNDPQYLVRLANGDPIPVPNVGRIVCENFEVNVKQTVDPKIQEWAPKGAIVHIQKNQRGIPAEYHFSNGSKIYLLSYDQDDRAFEGPNGHWGWFDEPPPQRKFNGIRRGLVDFDGTCWITATPLAEPWMNETLMSKANERNGRISLFYYSIWDNCVDNGGVLSRRAIQSFLDDLPDEERQAREYGIPLHLAGLVFPEWRPEAPFWIPEHRIPDSWPRVCVIDPHSRKPIAVLWAAISPENIIYVYRTLFDRKLRTVADVSRRIKELEGWGNSLEFTHERQEHVAMRIIDTSANEQERTSGESVAEQFANYGLYCTDAYKRNKDAGINAIREALRIRGDWQRPGLVVMDCCVELKQNFQNFIWDRWGTSRQQGLKGEKQEVIKNNDDFIDCVRYIFQMRLTFSMLRSLERRSRELRDEDIGGMPLELKPRGRKQWVKPVHKSGSSRWIAKNSRGRQDSSMAKARRV